jgi:hypothetical protein
MKDRPRGDRFAGGAEACGREGQLAVGNPGGDCPGPVASARREFPLAAPRSVKHGLEEMGEIVSTLYLD